MTLKERITEDMKDAMRAKAAARLSAIRLLLAAIKQKEIDERILLTDAQISLVIEKQVKQRKDSISQYTAANRPDLADAERFELDLLAAYLPEQVSAAELATAIDLAIVAADAKSQADMGKVISILKVQLAGRVDMGEASRCVKAKLNG